MKEQMILHVKNAQRNLIEMQFENAHKTFHEGIIDFECEEFSNKKVSKKCNLKIHRKNVHEGIKDFECEECAING